MSNEEIARKIVDWIITVDQYTFNKEAVSYITEALAEASRVEVQALLDKLDRFEQALKTLSQTEPLARAALEEK